MIFIDFIYLFIMNFISALFFSIFYSCSISFCSDVLTCSQFYITGHDSLLFSKCRISPELLVSVIIFFFFSANTPTHTLKHTLHTFCPCTIGLETHYINEIFFLIQAQLIWIVPPLRPTNCGKTIYGGCLNLFLCFL